MGKRIRVQRRGRGGSVFKASTHKRVAPARYPLMTTEGLKKVISGVIEEFIQTLEEGRL